MRIAVDADHLFRYPLRGIQKTTLAVYRHLAEVKPDWAVEAFHQVPGDCPPLRAIPTVQVRQIDIRGDRFRGQVNLWEQVRLPIAARLNDLLHVPSNLGSSWAFSPLVLTVHDLTPLDFPTEDSPLWWKGVRRSARGAHRIVTCSHFVAERIAQELPEVRHRIRVIHWGWPEGYGPADAESQAAVAAQYQLGQRPYVLTFATRHPRKNIRRVIASWRALPAAILANYQLVVVGLSNRELEAIGSGGEVGDPSFRGLVNVEERDLPALTSGAVALCYLSLSEGFGLPVLEGFACGTPVIASNASSVPEVAGDAAVLVDPTSEAEITQALSRVLTSDALQQDLRQRGRARADAFSWTTCASQYAAVFEECAS